MSTGNSLLTGEKLTGLERTLAAVRIAKLPPGERVAEIKGTLAAAGILVLFDGAERCMIAGDQRHDGDEQESYTSHSG